MVCGVRRCYRLPCRTGCGDRSLISGLPRRRVSSQRSLHRNPCLDFSVRPSTGCVQRVLRSDVTVLAGKKRQHPFGAVCSPSRKENVVGSFQWAPAVNANKSSISHNVPSWLSN
jgi:hypothetical protein